MSIQSKSSVLCKSLIGTNTTIDVTFRNDSMVTYNHNNAFAIMQSKLESLPYWEKHKAYTSGGNSPVVLQNKDMS